MWWHASALLAEPVGFCWQLIFSQILPLGLLAECLCSSQGCDYSEYSQMHQSDPAGASKRALHGAWAQDVLSYINYTFGLMPARAVLYRFDHPGFILCGRFKKPVGFLFLQER